jgi:hypothetical protein
VLHGVILDSSLFERRSKQYNNGEGRSVEWERAVVTWTKPIRSIFIILYGQNFQFTTVFLRRRSYVLYKQEQGNPHTYYVHSVLM